MTARESKLPSHPLLDVPASVTDWRTAVLLALGECEHVCLSCADACAGEDAVERLRACARLTLDCATICSATAAVVLHQTENSLAIVWAQFRACAAVCGVCAELCATLGEEYEYCRICAGSCRDCQAKCNSMLGENSASRFASPA